MMILYSMWIILYDILCRLCHSDINNHQAAAAAASLAAEITMSMSILSEEAGLLPTIRKQKRVKNNNSNNNNMIVLCGDNNSEDEEWRKNHEVNKCDDEELKHGVGTPAGSSNTDYIQIDFISTDKHRPIVLIIALFILWMMPTLPSKCTAIIINLSKPKHSFITTLLQLLTILGILSDDTSIPIETIKFKRAVAQVFDNLCFRTGIPSKQPSTKPSFSMVPSKLPSEIPSMLPWVESLTFVTERSFRLSIRRGFTDRISDLN